MIKTLIHALIACALGVALGLLWDSGAARAANVAEANFAIDHEAWQAAADLCARVTDGYPTSGNVCTIKTAPSESLAIWSANDSLTAHCRGGWPNATWEQIEKQLCDEVRAYIKQRWGY